RDNEITGWLLFFAETAMDAAARTVSRIDFLIAKAKFYERFRGAFNERQAKVVSRMFQEGPDGFAGGLNAEKYISISRTSRATATRDLAELLSMQAMNKTGELKGTRYHLNLDRKLAEKRIFPAVDINRSSTRREELLLDATTLRQTYALRRMVSMVGDNDGTELMLARMAKAKTNAEFLSTLGRMNS
ncbi:MAG: hypothetical protein WCG26_04240, partial [Chloroflexales bacterium]